MGEGKEENGERGGVGSIVGKMREEGGKREKGQFRPSFTGRKGRGETHVFL